MIHSVIPKADLRGERIRGEEPSGAVRQRPPAGKSDTEGQSTSQATADRAMIDQVSSKVNEMLASAGTQLKIEVDGESERVVVKVVDQKSGDVVRQIPPEELLELQKYLSSPKGLLLWEQA